TRCRLNLKERGTDPGAPDVLRTRVFAMEPDQAGIGRIRSHAVVVAPAIAIALVWFVVVGDAGLQQSARLQGAERIRRTASRVINGSEFAVAGTAEDYNHVAVVVRARSRIKVVKV